MRSRVIWLATRRYLLVLVGVCAHVLMQYPSLTGADRTLFGCLVLLVIAGVVLYVTALTSDRSDVDSAPLEAAVEDGDVDSAPLEAAVALDRKNPERISVDVRQRTTHSGRGLGVYQWTLWVGSKEYRAHCGNDVCINPRDFIACDSSKIPEEQLQSVQLVLAARQNKMEYLKVWGDG